MKTIKLKQGAKQAFEWTAAGLGQHRRPNKQSQLWILMYHRILPNSDSRYREEEPGMVVTPETFRNHLRLLPEFFDMVSLSHWNQLAEQGLPLPEKACAITFDDGWRDNYEHALPALIEARVPATLFAVADIIGTNRRFWPNRVAYLMNHCISTLRKLPEAQWLTSTIPLNEAVNWEMLATTIAKCKACSDDMIEERLDTIETLLGVDKNHQPDLMSWEELREMQASGLVEIGSHTRSHRRLLAGLDHDTVRREIVDSQTILEQKLSTPVQLFCYPNGDYSDAALKLVSDHYALAVTTSSGINNRASSRHQMQRIAMNEESSNSRTRLLARLSGWRK